MPSFLRHFLAELFLGNRITWLSFGEVICELSQREINGSRPLLAQFSVAGCQKLGCTRQGSQRSLNVILYQDTSNGAKYECHHDESVWRSVAVGTRAEAQFRVVGGGMLCSSVGGTDL